MPPSERTADARPPPLSLPEEKEEKKKSLAMEELNLIDLFPKKSRMEIAPENSLPHRRLTSGQQYGHRREEFRGALESLPNEHSNEDRVVRTIRVVSGTFSKKFSPTNWVTQMETPGTYARHGWNNHDENVGCKRANTMGVVEVPVKKGGHVWHILPPNLHQTRDLT